MSTSELKVEGAEQPPDATATNELNPRYKSWRKKYRKMKLRFDAGMEDANSLFLAQRKAEDTARRIQEQNDQLLELLLDLNEDTRISPSHRFELSSPTLQPLDQERTPDSTAGAPGLAPTKSLKDLQNKITHSWPDLPDTLFLPTDLQDPDDQPGYMDPKHEDEFLAQMDSSLSLLPLPSIASSAPVDGRQLAPGSVSINSHKRGLPTERDFAIESSISVYNWLRKHQPSVFADMKDKDFEKGEKEDRPGRSKGKKDKSVKKEDAAFEGLDEEIGFDAGLEEGVGSAKSRKKRDDDAYRPKGGRASTKRKRPREDDGGEGKSGTKKTKKTPVED